MLVGAVDTDPGILGDLLGADRVEMLVGQRLVPAHLGDAPKDDSLLVDTEPIGRLNQYV